MFVYNVNKKGDEQIVEYQKSFINGKYIDLPVLESIHLVIYDRLKTFGYLKDIPESYSNQDIDKALADLNEIGWLKEIQIGALQ